MTLLLFSGRPNPSFDLEPAAATERLGARFKATRMVETARAGQTIVPSILGYQGIVVDNLAGVPDLPRRMIVFRERVEAHDGEATIRAAEDRALEDSLVALALERKAIDEDLAEKIRVK